MDQLKQVRELQRQRYEAHVHKQYEEHINSIKPKIRYIYRKIALRHIASVIVRYTRKNWFLPIICNINPKYVPGRYLIRFTLNDSNKSNKKVQTKEKTLTEQEQLDKVLKESLMETNKSQSTVSSLSVEDQMRLAMMASLESITDDYSKETKTKVKKIESDDEKSDYESDSDYTYDESDDDSDEEMVNKILKENKKEESKRTDTNTKSYRVGFDLRYLAKNLDEPIKIFNQTYYLNKEQKDRAVKHFKRVDESTKTGEMFSQNLAYYKSLSKDMTIDYFIS